MIGMTDVARIEESDFRKALAPLEKHSAKRLKRSLGYFLSPFLHEMPAFGHFQRRRTMANLLAQIFHRGRSQYWVLHAHGHKRLSIPFRVPPMPRAPREPRTFGIGMVGHHLGKTSHSRLVSFIRKRSGIGGAFLGRQYIARARHHLGYTQIRIRRHKLAPG